MLYPLSHDDDVAVKSADHFGDLLRAVTHTPCEIAGAMLDRVKRTGTTIPQRLPGPLDVRIPVVLDGKEWLLHYAGQSLADVRRAMDLAPRNTFGPAWLPLVWPDPVSNYYLIGLAVLYSISESSVVMRVHMDDMSGNVTRVAETAEPLSDMVALRWIDGGLCRQDRVDGWTVALCFRADWDAVREDDNDR